MEQRNFHTKKEIGSDSNTVGATVICAKTAKRGQWMKWEGVETKMFS